jgi:hypothetical protein
MQFGFYSKPKNESVSIILFDDHGHQTKYQMLLLFRCDDSPPPLPFVEEAIKLLEITANITNITADGNVTITFSRNLIIPKVNLTEFPFLNVTVEGKDVPVLELSI